MPVKFPNIPPADWAARYIGTPWVWNGSRLSTGFDCAGFLHWSWTHDWGVTLPDWQEGQTDGGELHRTKQAQHLINHFLGGCRRLDRPVDGAGVLMKRGSVANHVGLYSGGDIIHACEIAGEVIRERLDDLKPKIVGFYIPAQTWTAPA